MTYKYLWINRNRGAMTASSPAWQLHIMDRVAAEYSDEAEKINRDFAAAVAAELAGSPLFPSRVISAVAAEIPRYRYIKDIEAPDGRYDAEIDLLDVAVSFIAQE